MDTTGTRTFRRDQWELGLIGAGLVLLFFGLPHGIYSDAAVRFQALQALLDNGKVSTTPYSLVGPLFSSPLYYLGRLFGSPDSWSALFNPLLFLGGGISLYFLLRGRADGGTLRTLALVLIAASMFPNHLRGYFGEVFTAVLVTVGIAALCRGYEMTGWALMVVGVVNTPASLVGLAFVCAIRAWDTRKLGALVPVAAAACAIMLEGWVRRGSPLITGYEGNHGAQTMLPYSGLPGFSYPMLLGLASLIFSFGKGLIFFAPGLLLLFGRSPIADGGTPSADRRVPIAEFSRLLTAFLIGLLLVYAKWWAWYAGWFWGPRYFLIASVLASLALAMCLQELSRLSGGRLLLVLAVLTLSAWVGVSGAVFDQSDLGRFCQQNDYQQEFLCWYVPEFSALWRPLLVRGPLAPGALLFVLYCGIVYVWLAAPVVKRVAALCYGTRPATTGTCHTP